MNGHIVTDVFLVISKSLQICTYRHVTDLEKTELSRYMTLMTTIRNEFLSRLRILALI